MFSRSVVWIFAIVLGACDMQTHVESGFDGTAECSVREFVEAVSDEASRQGLTYELTSAQPRYATMRAS